MGVYLWGARVTIPPEGRIDTLNILHETHPGMSRMKSLARHVGGQGGGKAIEDMTKKCTTCQTPEDTRKSTFTSLGMATILAFSGVI